MIGCNLRAIAAALGGQVSRGAVLAPGPGHSKADRSLSVRLSASSPDGFLTHSFSGDDWRTCRDYVADRLGLSRDRQQPRRVVEPTPRVAKADPTEEDRIARAAALWSEGVDPRNTIVEKYLRNRGLDLPAEVAGVAIRFHPACPWREGDSTIRVPVMLAAMRTICGDRVTAAHRTRLTPEGVKLDRRMLGIAAGAAVKLDADEMVTGGLTVGEGIETCLAARQLGARPVWALASAGAVSAFPVLGGIEALTLLRERDPVSDRGCHDCGTRWVDAGREVYLADPNVGNDINDAIREAA